MIAPHLITAALALSPAPQTEWVGVYSGTIGRHEVMVCLDKAGYGEAGSGSYYYLRHLKPIALSSDIAPGQWHERAQGKSWGDKTGPAWVIERIDAKSIAGTWRDKDRSLPIRLQRVEPRNAENWRMCIDPVYAAPRVKPPEFDRQETALGDFAYTRVSYRAPAHFEESVLVSSFTFAPTRPGDARIIAALQERLPKGSVEDAFLECLTGAVAVSGHDGDFQEVLEPHFVNREFVDVEVRMGDYCGGAYPNFGVWHRTFDRVTGEEISVTDWFSPDAFAPTEWAGASATEEMRTLAVKHWPTGGDPECAEAALEQSYWRVGLSADGLLLSPSFPHVAAACEEWLTVPWAELQPYLSDKGKAEFKRLR